MTIDYKSKWYEETKPNYSEFDTGIPEYWMMVYSDRWQWLSDCAGKDFFDSRKVLEIGCGMGRALKWFKEFGAIETGVEPSEKAGAIARERGLNVINDYYPTEKVVGKFDVIYIEQVLSHAPNYKEIIQKVYEALEPGGLLFVEEPNDNNYLQSLLHAKHGNYWITADHCNYFDLHGMREILTGQGFKVMMEMSTYPMEMFALMGEDYIGNDEIGKQVHRKRFELESKLSPEARRNMYKAWADMGIGRDLMFIAKKGV